jgi:hypothetical protein
MSLSHQDWFSEAKAWKVKTEKLVLWMLDCCMEMNKDVFGYRRRRCGIM